MAEISTSFSGSQAHGRAPGVHLRQVAPSPAAVTPSGVPLFIGFGQIRPQAMEQYAESTDRIVKFLRLTSWERVRATVSAPVAGSFLGYAVRGFFENGGERCVVCR